MSGATPATKQGAAAGLSVERGAAIRAAVIRLLAEFGYDRMSMEDIAREAKSSKATIYRRWPDKAALVAEALAAQFRVEDVIPDTGSLRGDLVAAMTHGSAAVNGGFGELFCGVATAARRDRRLRQVLNEEIFEAKATKFSLIVQRATNRGEITPGLDPGLLHEVVHCMISGRLSWDLGALDADYITLVVDQVLLPMASAPRRAARS
jgi:AcrR family transcriptional regulator